MKRLLRAASFFCLLLFALAEIVLHAQIWSPVLLPSPAQVLSYLERSSEGRNTWHATVTTMRRLLIGYIAGIIFGVAARVC